MPIRDSRPEGVYCRWESYPAQTLGICGNILVIERVNGEQSVSRMEMTRDEAHRVREFLKASA